MEFVSYLNRRQRLIGRNKPYPSGTPPLGAGRYPGGLVSSPNALHLSDGATWQQVPTLSGLLSGATFLTVLREPLQVVVGNVGAGADYASLAEALTFLAGYYPLDEDAFEFSTVTIQDGHVETVPIALNSADLSWVNVVAETSGLEISVDVSQVAIALGAAAGEEVRYITCLGAAAPRFSCFFRASNMGLYSNTRGLTLTNSNWTSGGDEQGVDGTPTAGFGGFHYNLLMNEASVRVRNCYFLDGKIASVRPQNTRFAAFGGKISADLGAVALQCVGSCSVSLEPSVSDFGNKACEVVSNEDPLDTNSIRLSSRGHSTVVITPREPLTSTATVGASTNARNVLYRNGIIIDHGNQFTADNLITVAT